MAQEQSGSPWRGAGKTNLGLSLGGPSDKEHQNLGPNRSVRFQQHLARGPSSKPEFCGGVLAGGRCEGGSPEAQG